MKTPLALYLTLTTLQVCSVGATFAKTDYICGKDVISELNIKTSIKNACYALYESRRKFRYPAVYSASDMFHVTDAILFSWPIAVKDKVYQIGHPGNLRLIIDSSCRFYGIIMKFKLLPDQRCYHPVEPPLGIDDSSNSADRRLSGIRGYNCKGEIFDSIYVEKVRRFTISELRGFVPDSQQTGLNNPEEVNKLFGPLVFLLPSEPPPDDELEISDISYFTVVDSQHKELGMAFRSEDKWERCDELWEMEPEHRQVSAPGINSVGETLFEGVGDYQCGTHQFTRKSVNSHMHVACKIIKDAQKSEKPIQTSRLRGAVIATPTGLFKAWKFPLQFYERENISRHESATNKCVIILDRLCNFHGVYLYDSRMRVACKPLSPPGSSGTNNPKISTPGPSLPNES
ncbi:putative candidate secreted effector protein [Blumeria hordei DH14]|uniref:Putative candidate secreted effector protein n=1 Tax=Blumeria graminis f. sp. hordei (strain DH14) TaxID=546991 RepID=N1J5B8_BLUG1|nr:putative candidate secreted effector protein [Blumeria hordei DH14]